MEYLLILCKKNFLEQHNFNPLSEDMQEPFIVYHLDVPDYHLTASNICTEKFLLCLFTSGRKTSLFMLMRDYPQIKKDYQEAKAG